MSLGEERGGCDRAAPHSACGGDRWCDPHALEAAQVELEHHDEHLPVRRDGDAGHAVVARVSRPGLCLNFAMFTLSRPCQLTECAWT